MWSSSVRELALVPSALALVALVTTGCADVRAPASSPADARSIDGLRAQPTSHAPSRSGGFARPLLASADEPASSLRSDGTPDAAAPSNAALSNAATSNAAHAYQAPLPALDGAAPAVRLAALSDRECEKEIARRAIPVDRKTKKTPGVSEPLRLAGPLHGVRFVTPGAESPNGVLDCRLVLALDDFAEALAKADVTAVHIDNFYRAHAHLPGKKTESQHAFALAADITSFDRKGKSSLSVERDWHAPIGSVSCGPDAQVDDPTEESIAIHDLVCDAARRGIFHHLLTPGFNAAHKTHLHFDIKRGETRQSVR